MSLIASILVIIIPFIVRSIMANKPDNSNKSETKIIEVEILDSMLAEEVRNLNDLQNVYNSTIYNLQKLNEEYQREVDDINEKIQDNYNSIEIQMQINPMSDISILKAQCDASNDDYNKRKNRLESMILKNEEKIISYKQKSNAISIKVDKIGQDEYRRQSTR